MSPQSSFLSNRHKGENSLISSARIPDRKSSLIVRFLPAACKLTPRLRRNRERELAECCSASDTRDDIAGRRHDLDEVLHRFGAGARYLSAESDECGRKADSQANDCQERKEHGEADRLPGQVSFEG